ncbi:MAG: hypothetical protein NPIRA04_24760 [Nitrospirales bacterium]|nr:MAG: hypothetical protein NPIRA04_24760 [Nitrospirales bacterium]
MSHSLFFRVIVIIGACGVWGIGPFVDQVFAIAMFQNEVSAKLTLLGIRDSQGTLLNTPPTGFTINGVGELSQHTQVVEKGNAQAFSRTDAQHVGFGPGNPTGPGRVAFPNVGIGDTLQVSAESGGSSEGNSLTFTETFPEVEFVFKRETPATAGTSYQLDFQLEYSVESAVQASDPRSEHAVATSTVFVIDELPTNVNPAFRFFGNVVSNNDTFDSVDFSTLLNHPVPLVRNLTADVLNNVPQFPFLDFPPSLSQGSTGQITLELPTYSSSSSALDSVRLRTFAGGGTFTGTEFANIVKGGGTPVPEPSTLLLFGSGLAGFAAWRARTKKF